MVYLNEADLVNAISRGLLVAVKHTVERIGEENTDAINEEIYDSASPTWYEETFDFLNAWDTKVSGGAGHVEGEMFYDSSQIGLGDIYNGQHVSVVDGSSQAENMPYILYQGGMGCIQRPTNRDAWKNLDKKLTNRAMRGIFEEGLSASGMPWKRKTGAITVTKTR